jgi:hypothetical protein
MLCNQQVSTNKSNLNKKPDTIVPDNNKETCKLTDVANSGDRNVIKKEAEKILKDKEHSIKIQRMWNVTNMTRVLISTTGINSKSFIKYLN